ncbi:glycosyltransferase family 4 protein [Hymenobacter caeli]|uniref:Glycosyltransferase involved in cell wall biosynthesis n=1 Tax=Hymenobacter caeli TaxID=2735894 RepID=A0ABX2FNJ0_9BACT|nr:glycosyltransferase family 4 protein [Hymenobacter caeli]NRT18735.1 glycosyltransferase involved in cell wall biosynthesis [Hymenobacter caeli]
MKILWLAPWPHPLDVDAHPVPWVGTLANLLKKQPEIELTVLNWSHRLASPVDEFTADGLRFIYLKTPTVRRDILTLYRRRIRVVRAYLRAHAGAYDLLHLHGSELQLPAMTAGLPVPQLLTVQGLVSQYPPFVPNPFSILKVLWTLAGLYERRYLPAVHHFSCRTHWDKALVRQLSPGCTVYHNWEVIRPEFFQPAAGPAALGRPQLVFLGGVQVMKGFREVLAALDLVRRQADVRLVVAGQATADEVRAAVRRAGLRHVGPDDVVCRGLLAGAELVQLFHESCCLLHPSYVDNSPNSVCEAQVAGLPVVVADVGGVHSLVEDEATGLFCTLAPASIAGQALRLLGDAALRQRLAHRAAAVARQRHDPAVIVARTLAAYRAVWQDFYGVPAPPAPAALAGAR